MAIRIVVVGLGQLRQARLPDLTGVPTRSIDVAP